MSYWELFHSIVILQILVFEDFLFYFLILSMTKEAILHRKFFLSSRQIQKNTQIIPEI